MTSPRLHTFIIGDLVEAKDHSVYKTGSYYSGVIVADLVDGGHRVLLDNVRDVYNGRRIETKVPIENLRPIPDKTEILSFQINQPVDVFREGGWWSGRIVRREEEKYFVLIDVTGSEETCEIEQLRLHKLWHEGVWCYLRWRP